MKIALLTNGIYPHAIGGMQKHSYYLAKYMARRGLFVTIYDYREYGQPLWETPLGFSDEELPFITYYCIEQKKTGRFPGHYLWESYILSRDFYRKLTQQETVDFVYAQGFSGWYYARKKTKDMDLPPIGVNFHGLEMFQKSASLKESLQDIFFRYFVAKILKSADFVFSLGGGLTPILEEIVDEKHIIELPIGVSKDWLLDEEFLKESQNRRKFVFVGRYERRKGLLELTSIIRALLNSHNFEFHFIGYTPEDMKIRSDGIVYHGVLQEEEIKHLLRGMDIFVLPSYAEGMPTVILEAMASGCAIIATDVGAVSEQVDDANGWLVEAGDFTSLREAIEIGIECKNELLLDKKRSSLKKIEEKFLWESVIDQTLDKITCAIRG